MGTFLQRSPLVPATGQETVYDTNDDGTFQSGIAVHAARYIEPVAGVTFDRHTGLSWVRQPEIILPGGPYGTVNELLVAKGNWAQSTAYIIGDLVSEAGGDAGDYYGCIEAHTSNSGGSLSDDSTKWIETIWTTTGAALDSPTQFTWANAIDNSIALDYAGYTDWRLPNIVEILSISDYSETYGVDTTHFPNNQRGDSDAIQWSSTTRKSSTVAACGCTYNFGIRSAAYTKTDTNYVRPVRGGRING
jgi:hypothetical protein